MRIVFTILILAITSILSANDYYVKNGGNDSNSGLNDANAWAHHPWMSTWTGSVVLAPGDIIHMKRGDTWSIANPNSDYMAVKQSGNAGNPITTTAYDVGAKPIVNISTNSNKCVIQGSSKSYIIFDNLDISHWSPLIDVESNKCGIQFGGSGSDTPHDWIITNCNIHNCPKIGISGFTDSYNITIGDTTVSSCATISSFSNNIYNCGYAGILLGGCDYLTLNSDFNIYYNYIHDINVAGTPGQNAYGCGVSASSSSSGFPRYVKMRYNYISNIPTWEGLDTHGGKYMYFQDNYIYNCYVGISTQAATLGSRTPILDHCYIERNTIEATINLAACYFIAIHGPGGDYRPNNIYVRDNTLFFTTRPTNMAGYGIKLGSCDGVTVEGNKVYNGNTSTSGGSVQVNEVKNAIIRNNLFLDWFGGIYLETGYIDGNIDIYNNIIYMSSGYGEPIWSSTGSTTGNISIYNNVFLSGAGTTFPTVVDFSRMTIANSTSLMFKNNIIGFSSADADGIYIRAPKTINGTFTCDYNLYWNSTKSYPFSIQGDYFNRTNWNARGYDTHSLFDIDPLFENGTGTFSNDHDFVLESSSSAINKGSVVPEVTTDYFGNPRDAAPDIGASEYYVSNQTIKVTVITVTGSAGASTIITDNGTLQLSASISPSDATNKTITWSVANGTGQATISSAGLVSAVANGTVTAKATANDGSGVNGTLVITVSNQVIPVTGITVTGSGGASTIITDNGTLQLSASISPSDATNKTVTWSVANGTGQATISSAGLVSAVANGTVTAKATASDGSGVNGTLVITISNQVSVIDPVFVSASVENVTPSRLEINYSLSLANIVPSISAFTVRVNSVARAINSIVISGTQVLLTLLSPIYYGDVVAFTYTKPVTSYLQTPGGGQASTLSNQTVINRVTTINANPVIVVNSPKRSYSGFVNEINARGSYDPNKDNLIFSWSAPVDVPISSNSGSAIRFLGPLVNQPTTIEFTIKVSDGKTTVSKTIPVEIMPYKPELEMAEVLNVEASSFTSNNYPFNILDGNTGTMWSAEGDDQWLIIEMKELFEIQHIKMAFQPGQRKESYFDILVSGDKETWEPVLIKSISCDFSGNPQTFDFPTSKTIQEFKYVKLVGHCNSTDTWNYISEFKIFGYKSRYPSTYNELPVKVYPNPANRLVNIRIDDPNLVVDFIKIVSISGKVMFKDKINPGIIDLQIPINLLQGIYFVQIGLGDLIKFTQKLIISI